MLCRKLTFIADEMRDYPRPKVLDPLLHGIISIETKV